MERIKAGANSRSMRLAQEMIVGGALFLDRVANGESTSAPSAAVGARSPCA
jgi:hypothetical protein